MKKAIVFLSLIASTLIAQTPTATLSGYVQDTSGAAIQHATLTVRNIATGVTHTATTGTDGEYQLFELSPGAYEASASAPGFQTEVQTGVVLQVDERAQTNFALKIGQVTETVQVGSEAALVDTQSSSIGAVIDNRDIGALPLISRSFESSSAACSGGIPTRTEFDSWIPRRL